MSQQFKKGDEVWFWGSMSKEPVYGIVDCPDDGQGRVLVGHPSHTIRAILMPDEVFTSPSACIDAEVAKEVKRHEDAMKRLEGLRG